MKSSGIIDTKGNVLYEGDIVEWEENAAASPISMGILQDGYSLRFIKKRATVIFKDGCFQLSEPRISTLMGPQSLLKDVSTYIEKI